MAQTELREPTELDVAVVGAGAAGIGMGVVLNDLDIDSFAVLERDEIGASFRRWPDEMRFITPSFPSNGFGCRDLNAVTKDTSPAYALDREHPSGPEYAGYLESVADFHDLPVYTGVTVESVERDVTARPHEFVLETDGATVRSKFVVWAGGQFGAPNDDPFPGADLCVHNARVGSWRRFADECVGDHVVVVGGYESGIDAALALVDLGYEVTVVDEDAPWRYRGPDPSEVLSPYTMQRLDGAMSDSAPITFHESGRVDHVRQTNSGFDVVTSDGRVLETENRPVLATGFDATLGPVESLFAETDGHPELTDADESTKTPNLFLAGPQVSHDGQRFCFVYKFRQRFAVVADAIAARLGVDRTPLEAYREENMFLEDLDCCEPDLCDC